MPSVYVRKLLVLLQFVWLCGRDTDGTTEPMVVSNPASVGYTIYGFICGMKACRNRPREQKITDFLAFTLS